ncbi:hypothetical protein HS070_03730 [Mannheimia haemolytica]
MAKPDETPITKAECQSQLAELGVQYKNCQWQLQDIFVMPQPIYTAKL